MPLACCRYWLPPTACLFAYGLPLRLRPASMPTFCLQHIIIIIVHLHHQRRHRHHHRPSPVQVERLSFSLCDFIYISSFLKLFFFLFFF
jgi:hypothetical protein